MVPGKWDYNQRTPTGMDEPFRRAKMAAGIFGGENRKTITGAGEARGERFKIVMVSR